jgi:transposase
MKVQHIIGADVSKKTIDLVCHLTANHCRIDNSAIGYDKMLKWLDRQSITLSAAMVVMEHTGLYSCCFEDFLHRRQMAFVKVGALAIKRSMGLVRGKSDKIDAARIAAYGFEKKDKLVANIPLDATLQAVQRLYSLRDKLVKQRAALKSSLIEYSNIGLAPQDLVIQSQQEVVKTLTVQIGKIEKQIEALIAGQPALNNNFCLLKSIKGVGKVLATAALIKTHNFTRFANARKFACYCGTAPFEHSSGTSIKGRTRVSQLADKQMKTLLDLAAKSAIQNDKELRDFYLRRTATGKSKMSTINIVRNKLLHRMFAVIKRQSPFTEKYLQVA